MLIPDHIAWAVALIAVIVAPYLAGDDKPDPNEEPLP